MDFKVKGAKYKRNMRGEGVKVTRKAPAYIGHWDGTAIVAATTSTSRRSPTSSPDVRPRGCTAVRLLSARTSREAWRLKVAP